MHIQYTIIEAPPGSVWVAESRHGVIYIGFGENQLGELTEFVNHWFESPQIIPSIVDASSQIEDYLAGRRRKIEAPVDLKGTEFQLSVWNYLKSIPYGETSSYGQIAEAIGRPGGARAVGQACGANPVPLIIPCHRVLNSEGGLGGFGGGTHWKKWLLELESGKTAS